MSSSWQQPASIFAIILLLASAITCRSNKDPVSELMAELEEAAEARDAKVFEKRLASGFSGNNGISREETLAMVRRYFAAYETIHLDVMNVERTGAANRVKFHVSFSGKGKAAFNLQNLLPSTAAYDFELRLGQEDDLLKVKKAFWRNTSAF